LGGSEVDFTVH